MLFVTAHTDKVTSALTMGLAERERAFMPNTGRTKVSRRFAKKMLDLYHSSLPLINFQWNVQYNSRSGAYLIENFGHAGVFLTTADSSRRYAPHAEINSYIEEWVLHEAPDGHGFLSVAGRY